MKSEYKVYMAGFLGIDAYKKNMLARLPVFRNISESHIHFIKGLSIFTLRILAHHQWLTSTPISLERNSSIKHTHEQQTVQIISCGRGFVKKCF